MEKMAHSILIKTSRSSWVNNIKYQISNIKYKITNKNYLIFLILLLAVFLRLYRIQDYMTFLGDEGRDALVVYNILHGHLTLLGPTASVGGFFLGPIYYYFMTPFLWVFNYNPVGPAVMVALFGIATVWLIYKVGSEFLGNGIGFIAAFLYSISPLIIAYSRSSWNPNLMPFFSLPALYILYKAVNTNKIKLFIYCGILLGISMQLHYLAIFLGVIVAAYILLTRILLREGVSLQKTILRILKDYFYILIGFFIGWLPFLAFEIRHGFPNIRSILSFIFNSGDTGGNDHFLSTIYDVFFRLFARLITNFPPPEQVSAGMHKNITLWYYGTLLLAVASVLVFIGQLVKSTILRHPEFISGSHGIPKEMPKQVRHDRERFQKISLLVLWLVVGIGLFGFYKKPIYDYYFGFVFPLPFLLVGMLISSLYNSRVGKIFSIIIFVILAWINFKDAPFRYLPNRQLAQVEEISKFVINKTENKPFNFALIASGNSDHAYRYFFTIWGKPPLAIENTQIDPKRHTVTEQLLVICEKNPCSPLGYSLWEVAGFGRGEIVGEWNVSVVKAYKLEHYNRVE